MGSDFGGQRATMVESQVRVNDVTDYAIQDAMRLVAREAVLPPGKAYLAYADTEVEYAPGRWLLKPRDVAKLLQAIRPRPNERALAICAPYAAAVLARIGLDVTARAPDGDCVEAGRKALADEGVRVVAGDPASVGDEGPYDVIVCEGAVEQAPAAWQAAVGVGGRLGVVERMGPVGKARLYVRGDDGLVARREMFDATPPVMPGFEAVRGSAF